MRVTIPMWVGILCLALVLVLVCIALIVSDLTRPRGRDLNELTHRLVLGMRSKDVARRLGPPTVVSGSLADLEPYRVSPPNAEEVWLYAEYPWGILVYVDKKKQWVTRLILVRHP